MKVAYKLLTLCVVSFSSLETGAFSPIVPRSSGPSSVLQKTPQLVSLKESLSYGSETTVFDYENEVRPIARKSAKGAMERKGTISAYRKKTDKIWDAAAPVKIQGGALRTWTFPDATIDRVQILMNTEGRPLHANIDLWEGPDNTPQKMAVYIEDAQLRQFNTVVETPGFQKTIGIRNTAQTAFPINAIVVSPEEGTGFTSEVSDVEPLVIQGGSVRTYSFHPFINAVKVMLKTDGRPLNARIEIMQGPNTNKHVVEVYTEDGVLRPFIGFFETPGNGNVVRVVNTAPLEYPMTAAVEPCDALPGGTYKENEPEAPLENEAMRIQKVD